MGDFHSGRGANTNPAHSFTLQRLQLEPDDSLALEFGDSSGVLSPTTEVYLDSSRSILSKNDSPDIPFRYSVNPYRGCEHGCIYCYARPSHEYLGFSAGLDFESRIVAKPEAAHLLSDALSDPQWEPELICLSGNTDPWQPVERRLGLSRACLKVFLEHRHPCALITKNALILRDLDLLSSLAARNLVSVTISVTTLDPEIARVMEPRASTPSKRVETIREISAAGIPVAVNVAPIVPGLTDSEIPAILEAAWTAGARRARYIVMRLPGPVEGLFTDWVKNHFPARASRIFGRLRALREGQINDSRFHRRMSGTGPIADLIRQFFETTVRRLGMATDWPLVNTKDFLRHPGRLTEHQEELFS